jgi:hypothetical protein
MIHRILEGQKASDVARALLGKKKIVMAWDLSPYFVNCVRVLSLPAVITPEDQQTFDDMLADEGWESGVRSTHDVGAFLRVVGNQIMA